MTQSGKLIPALLIALALAACGKKEEAQTAAPAQPAAEAAKPAEEAKPAEGAKPEEHANAGGDDLAKGEEVFKKTCSMCHQTGAAGAPKFGNKDEWGPRIAQGLPTLYDHALKGFTGKNGMMPARGGNTSLSDDDVKAGVNYMVSKAK